MKDLPGKISTYPQVKIALKKFAEKKDIFTTQEVVEELIERSGRITINNNKIAQYLRSIKTHEYDERLKKWIKTRP